MTYISIGLIKEALETADKEVDFQKDRVFALGMDGDVIEDLVMSILKRERLRKQMDMRGETYD